MIVQVEIRGEKHTHYIKSDLTDEQMLDMLEAGHKICMAKSPFKDITRKTIENVVYLNEVSK